MHVKSHTPSDDMYEEGDIVGVYAATVAVGLTILLCAAMAGLAFFNTFGAYTSWIYGPPALYLLALISGQCFHNIIIVHHQYRDI